MCLKPFRDWSPHYVSNGLFVVKLYTFNSFDSTDTPPLQRDESAPPPKRATMNRKCIDDTTPTHPSHERCLPPRRVSARRRERAF
jgi:hypothetical protein